MSVFPDNGIISLSRLRQSAKQRLRRIKTGEEPISLLRLHQMNPRAELNLAAVQWLIATEMGFDNWPALKAHTDAIRFAAQYPGFEAGSDLRNSPPDIIRVTLFIYKIMIISD